MKMLTVSAMISLWISNIIMLLGHIILFSLGSVPRQTLQRVGVRTTEEIFIQIPISADKIIHRQPLAKSLLPPFSEGDGSVDQ